MCGRAPWQLDSTATPRSIGSDNELASRRTEPDGADRSFTIDRSEGRVKPRRRPASGATGVYGVASRRGRQEPGPAGRIRRADMSIAIAPPLRPAPSSTSCSTSSPTSSSSAGSRATRSRPTAPTCCSSARSSTGAGSTRSTAPARRPRRRSSPSSPAARRSAPPVAAATLAAQGRLPALVLPPPAPRGLDRPRPDRRAARARARPSACRRCSAATRSRGCSRSRAGPSRCALRDRALLELMYACGLRASEAVGLELGDVDLEEGVLRARGKGSKERLVPVGREAVAALRAYLRARPPEARRRCATEPHLFVNQPRRRRSRARGSTRSSRATRAAPGLRATG